MNNDKTVAGPAGRSPRKHTVAVAAAVGVAGLLAGGLAAGAISEASAGSGTGGQGRYGAPQGYAGRPPAGQNADPSKPMRGDEELLTGETKRKVLAAVEAKYPDATIQQLETDSEGVYEAHIVNDGTPMIVQVGKGYTITGTQSGGPGGPGGPGGEHGGQGGVPGGEQGSRPAPPNGSQGSSEEDPSYRQS